MKAQVFFNRIAKYFWRYRSAASRPACFCRCVTTDALAADECRSQLKSPKIAAAEGHERADGFRRYSQTEGRALSLRLRKIVGPRQKGTHDSRLPFRDAP